MKPTKDVRFVRNQKVIFANDTRQNPIVHTVSHWLPDDAGNITICSTDGEMTYQTTDQWNLCPLTPKLGLQLEHRVPRPGELVVVSSGNGTYSIHTAGTGVTYASFVITNITEQDNT